MKYIISTILAVMLSQGVQAQDFSLGIRTGLGKNLDVTRISNGTIDNAWDKELFLRYQTKSRLAFEAGATHYNYRRAGIWHSSGCIVDYEPLYFDAPTHENLLTLTNVNMIDLSLGVQYDISCKALQEKCPIMKQLRSYVGASVIGKYANVNTQMTDRRLSDGSIRETTYRDNSLNDIHLGINHTLNYTISKLYITSVVGYSVSSTIFQGSFTDRSVPVGSRLSFRIGVGYTL